MLAVADGDYKGHQAPSSGLSDRRRPPNLNVAGLIVLEQYALVVVYVSARACFKSGL